MPFQHRSGLRLYTFESLTSHELDHSIATRQGGVSGGPWESLNVGGNVGDAPEHVAENRQRVLRALGRTPDSTFDVWQVHGDAVIQADAPRQGPPYPKADAVITDRPAVTLMLRFADCLPIMLYDPERRAIGLVHAGWRGTHSKVAANAVRAMAAAYQSRPEALVACFGPSVAAHHYPVGSEVVAAMREALGDGADAVVHSVDGDVHVDLAAANELILRAEGVTEFEHSDLCTACVTEDWYSHRAEQGQTGRFAAVVALAK